MLSKEQRKKLFSKRNLIIMLFLVFVVFRLFYYSPTQLLGGDPTKFMEAAKRFPSHELYNDQLYTLHPPLYPYFIYFATLIFQDDFIASLAISFITSAILFFVIYAFFMGITKSFTITYLVLVFFTLSNQLIMSAQVPLREAIVLLFLFLSLHYYAKGLMKYEKTSIWLAALFAGMSALLSDHAVFLAPSFGIAYLILNREKLDFRKFKFPFLKYAIIPGIVLVATFLLWTGVKAYAYSNNEYAPYFPIGPAGVPLNVGDATPMNLVNPASIPGYDRALPENLYIGPIATLKKYAFNLGYMFNLEPFSIPRGLNFSSMHELLFAHHVVYMFVIYLPLALLAVYGTLLIIFKFLRGLKIHGNTSLYFFLTFLVFMFPITQRFTGPRYTYPAYFFLFFILSLAIVHLFEKRMKFNLLKKAIPALSIVLLIFVPFWIFSQPHFLFTLDNVVSGYTIADYLNNNVPKGTAIMAQPGFSVQMIYLTGNRVIALPPDPEQLPEMIKLYGTEYIVFGRYFTWDEHHFSIDSVEYIRNNPDKFEPVIQTREDFSTKGIEPEYVRDDEVYLYRVK